MKDFVVLSKSKHTEQSSTMMIEMILTKTLDGTESKIQERTEMKTGKDGRDL